MPQRSSYKPETPRPGTEKATNDKNIQNIFAILNRMEARLNNLEEYVNTLVTNVITPGDEASKTFSLMNLDVE